jgi:hypothetical protein
VKNQLFLFAGSFAHRLHPREVDRKQEAALPDVLGNSK